MTIKELSIYIHKVIENRFVKELKNDISEHLLVLDEKNLNKSICRIQRHNETELNTYRTVLLVQLKVADELKSALEWVASVKNSLTDPETSDLYLILISEQNIFTIDDSMRIESTEQFCRKYVQRGNENPKDLISRTCLASLNVKNDISIQSDPVNKALSETSQKFPWFKESEQAIWKEAFYSEDTGNELMDRIK